MAKPKRSAFKTIKTKGNGDAIGPKPKRNPATGKRKSKVANIA